MDNVGCLNSSLSFSYFYFVTSPWKKIMAYVRVWFIDSWFTFHDSSWNFHKPYFSKKHISQIIWSEKSIKKLQISTELLGNVIVSKAFSSRMSPIVHFFIEWKFYKHCFLQGWKWQIAKTGLFTIQIFFLLFDLLQGQKSISQNYPTAVFNEISRYIKIHKMLHCRFLTGFWMSLVLNLWGFLKVHSCRFENLSICFCSYETIMLKIFQSES